MAINKVKKRRGFKSYSRYPGFPKPVEKSEAKEESKPEDGSAASGMTAEQKAIFYPFDIPNPPANENTE